MSIDGIRDKILFWVMIFMMIHLLVSYIKLIYEMRREELDLFDRYPTKNKHDSYKTIRIVRIIKTMILCMESIVISILFSLSFMSTEKIMSMIYLLELKIYHKS